MGKSLLNIYDNNDLVGFVALRPKSTAMVIAGRSVHLTTLITMMINQIVFVLLFLLPMEVDIDGNDSLLNFNGLQCTFWPVSINNLC